MEKKKINTLDIDGKNFKINGVAYFRISKEFKEFLTMCNEKEGIIGFEFEDGSYNFGVILGSIIEDCFDESSKEQDTPQKIKHN